MSKNSFKLRALIEEMQLTEVEALVLWNKNQAPPLSEQRWKAYLAPPNSALWKPCPDSVVLRMEILQREWQRPGTGG